MTHSDQSTAVYRDRWSGQRFIVERRDGHYVYGQREFEKDAGDFEPWSARIPNFEQCYVASDEHHDGRNAAPEASRPVASESQAEPEGA